MHPSSSKMGFLAHVALNDPTPGKRVHSMTPPSEQLKEISQVALDDPSSEQLKEILSISLKKISPRQEYLYHGSHAAPY